MYFPRLGGGDTERNFERFVRAIRQCNNLSDARRFKSEVASQLAREASIKDQDEIYLRRLKTGKRLLDQKVEKLAAIGRSTEETSHHLDSPRGRDSQGGESATLLEVLRDAAGLSYFMEYMDRHRLMTLVQFWVVVDGFRNPLENDVHDDEEIPNAPLKWTNSDRLDIAQIHDAYLSKPELGVPEERRLPVKSFLEAGVSATPLQHHRARSAILRTQTAVLDEMRTQHFPRFKRSDLYYKYLTVDESPTKPGPKFAQHAARQLEFAPAKELPLHTSKGPRSAAYRPANDNKLRRAAASSSDLTSTKERLANGTSQRRSLDVNPSAPLFPEDDYDTDPLAHSTEIINTDGNSLKDNQLDGSQEQMVQAMEAALNDIVENRPQVDNARIALFDSQESGSLSPHLLDSSRASTEFSRIKSPHGSKDPRKPNLASLGLISTSSRLGVFSDENLFDDGEKFLEDEHTDPEEAMKEKLTEDEIVQAAPGDLGLAEAISALTLDLERLVIQDSIVDTLTRKAELTNNVAELRILGKSKSSLEREIRRKELQRQQYIAQESDNSLFGRATVEIKSIMVGKDEEGQEFALCELPGYAYRCRYSSSADVIEVQRKAGEQMPAASWAVARRYSEFHDLHQRLRSTHPAVRQLDFPRRRLVLKLQKDFLQKRRSSLEKYLRVSFPKRVQNTTNAFLQGTTSNARSVPQP